MRFRIDDKVGDGPWRPRTVTAKGAYRSVAEMLNFLAWFRAQDPNCDYRATRLRTKGQLRKAQQDVEKHRRRV